MNKYLNRLAHSKTQLLAIVFIWILIQSILFLQNGIKPILESLKYIGAAEMLLETGHLPELRYFFYLSTTLVIAFCLKMGFGISGAIVIQLIISLVATIFFYKALAKIQTRNFSALITTLTLTLCIPFYTWNFYLYTESLFYSFALLFFSHCIFHDKITIKIAAIQFTLLLLVIISRPLGILFLPCWIIYLINKVNNKYRTHLFAGFILCVIVLAIVSNLVLGNISDWQILKPAEFNYVICDIPTGRTYISEYIKDKAPLTQLFLYITTYPSAFFSIALKRIQAFLFLTRDYYSILHNTALMIFSFILYLPILFNMLMYYAKKKTSITVLSYSIVVLFCLAIILQCDDYHNRFHNTIIPVFLYLGLYGFLEESTFINTTSKNPKTAFNK